MSKKSIKSILAHQVYMKRGYPGVEVIVKTEGGHTGRAECTAELSIGTYEVAFTYDSGSRHGSGKPSYTIMAYDFDTCSEASILVGNSRNILILNINSERALNSQERTD